MVPLLALVSWIALGLASAYWFSERDDTRWEWAPMALILGPLWPAIALEQRSSVEAPAIDLRTLDERSPTR